MLARPLQARPSAAVATESGGDGAAAVVAIPSRRREAGARPGVETPADSALRGGESDAAGAWLTQGTAASRSTATRRSDDFITRIPTFCGTKTNATSAAHRSRPPVGALLICCVFLRVWSHDWAQLHSCRARLWSGVKLKETVSSEVGARLDVGRWSAQRTTKNTHEQQTLCLSPSLSAPTLTTEGLPVRLALLEREGRALQSQSGVPHGELEKWTASLELVFGTSVPVSNQLRRVLSRC